MNIPSFNINANKTLSILCQKNNIHEFNDLCHHVENIKYTRISNAHNLSLILEENCGTCSTKHAFLKQVALENNKNEIQLIVGIFKMNKFNTPAIKFILEKYNINYIPEAHCYLKINEIRFDFTKPEININDFKKDLLIEKEINPNQVGEWKSNYQKKFISNWLIENPSISYNLKEVWEIRELCIQALAD